MQQYEMKSKLVTLRSGKLNSDFVFIQLFLGKRLLPICNLNPKPEWVGIKVKF